MVKVKLNPSGIKNLMTLVTEIIKDNGGKVELRGDVISINDDFMMIEFLSDGFELYSKLESEDDGHLAGFYYLTPDLEKCAEEVHHEAVSHSRFLD